MVRQMWVIKKENIYTDKWNRRRNEIMFVRTYFKLYTKYSLKECQNTAARQGYWVSEKRKTKWATVGTLRPSVGYRR